MISLIAFEGVSDGDDWEKIKPLFEKMYCENGISEDINERIAFITQMIWGDDGPPPSFHSMDLAIDGKIIESGAISPELELDVLELTYATSVGWIYLDLL